MMPSQLARARGEVGPEGGSESGDENEGDQPTQESLRGQPRPLGGDPGDPMALMQAQLDQMKRQMAKKAPATVEDLVDTRLPIHRACAEGSTASEI